MALSVQNKKFLAVLNKIDIDVKQFPDKTFDGLFDNVPEVVDYFFNWFIENITPDNALTQAEQITYYELENNQSIPTEEEINYVLSSCHPTFEELMSLDINYVNNFLPEVLNDFKKNYEELSDIATDIQSNYVEIKKKKNSLKEEIHTRRRMLDTIKQDCRKMNLFFGSKIDEVKTFLLNEPHYTLNLDLFYDLLKEENNIISKFKTSKLLENDIFNCSKIDSLPKLEEDLAYVEISIILSEVFLKEKKARIDFLLDCLQNKSSLNSFNNSDMLEVFEKGIEEDRKKIKTLEAELFEKSKNMSHNEVQKILDQYFSDKLDLSKSYLFKLTQCKEYIESNWKMNLCLLHILLNCKTNLENTLKLKEELYMKLNEYESNFKSSLANLELLNQRFKNVVLHQSQHPFLSALKNVMSLEENPENNEETLKNITELILHANDDSNFITHKFRSNLQSSFKAIFDNTLCGPTSQFLFVPIELLIKFQNCCERESNLSQALKRLASKYVDVKETISKSDRKKLLSWIDILTNPQALRTNNSTASQY